MLLDNSLGWTKISKVFQASGGENFITIGNFSTSTNSGAERKRTHAQFPNTPHPTYNNTSYYYIDDIELYEIPNAGESFIVCSNSAPSGNITLGIGTELPFHLNPVYTWEKLENGVKSTIYSGPDFLYDVPHPTSTTTYFLTVGINDGSMVNTSTSSITVTVSTPPSFNTSGNVTICGAGGQPITLSANSNGSTPYTWFWHHESVINTQFTLSTTSVVSPTATTTYFVSGTDAAGCWITKQITVMVSPAPAFTVSPPVTICAGQSVTLIANSSIKGAVYNYEWSDGSPTPYILGPSITVNPTTTTTYTVTATNANCVTSKQVTVTVLSCRSSNPNQSNTPTTIYPNPAAEFFIIDSKGGSSYRIFDNLGTEVQKGSLNGEKTKVDINKLKKGLFLLHIQNGKEIEKKHIEIK